MKFFTFRHGETDWNVERRFQGHTDIPLNANGLSQAHELAGRLKGLGLELVLSSDLGRAHATAQVACRDLALEIRSAPELREVHLGDAEGLLLTEVIERHGEDSWTRWISGKAEDLDCGYPNGETKRSHRTRLQTFLTHFCHTHPALQKVGVSTHGGCVARLVHACHNAPTESFRVANAELHVIDYDMKTGIWTYEGRI